MNDHVFELEDGRFLGVAMFEIVSFPGIISMNKVPSESCKVVYTSFVRLVKELHMICGQNSCLEFMWLTEKAVHQTFAAKIRIFVIIRKIETDKKQLKIFLSNVRDDITAFLAFLQYTTGSPEIACAELPELLKNIDDSFVYAIVKREKITANINSAYPYYCTDVIPNQNYVNFNSLIAALSQHERCCVCFQIFPTSLSGSERQIINEVTGELSKIVSGTVVNGQIYRDISATEPLKVFSYYDEKSMSPLFLYNILIWGDKAACAGISPKIVSLLQSGEEKIGSSDFLCLDLSGENIRLQEQFPYYAWNVNTLLLRCYRNLNIQKLVPLAGQLFRLPYLVSAEEAAVFCRLPLYEKMMVSLKNNQIVQIQEQQFSGTVVNENNIKLGKWISNDNVQIEIGCPPKAFTKHALIVGMPGSGKTTFSIQLLLQFYKKKIPFLAIEPTKTEYRAMIDRIPELQIFTPGNSLASPYIINPFIPPKGIRIEQYIPSLASAFKAAFSMPSPLDMIFMKAIRNCYIQYGWKDYSMADDADVQAFGLYEFILVFKKLMESTAYSREVKGNIESAGLLRLMNLIEQNSNIYDSINTVPIEDLLTVPTVIELNSIDNAEQKALIIALLLINICLYTKHNQKGDGELKKVVMIDEAHVLLGSSATSMDGAADPQGATIKAIQDMIVEIRSYGTSIIIADQSPTKVSREVVANTDIKVAFRLVQSAEKELIADSTNMDEDAKNMLSKLKPGEAYVYYNQMESPQVVVTEDIREKEGIRFSVSDSEIARRGEYWKYHQHLLKPYVECKLCSFCADTCNFRIRADAEYIADKAFSKYFSSIKSKEHLKKCIYFLPILMEEDFSNYSQEEVRHLQTCARIKLFRKIQLDKKMDVSKLELTQIITDFPKESKKEVNADV